MVAKYEERAKGVIKCFFVMNQGKWVSAKQISEFLQENKSLRLGRYGDSLSPRKVSYLLGYRLFDDLKTDKRKGKKVYRYDGS